MIDAYSKWNEVYPPSSTSATATIEKLRQVFATHGLPDKVVSDNGISVASEEFRDFMIKNRILKVKTAPRHPSSNGLMERSVRIFKDGRKRLEGSPGTVHTKFSRFLLAYRSTPQKTTGVTPAVLLFNRCLRTRLDLIRPDLRQRVETQQLSQKVQHDSRKKERQFAERDKVLVKVARYCNSFSGSVPPKFKHKLRRNKQRFGKIATTVVADINENLL